MSWSLGEENIWCGPPDEGGLSELILKDCWSDDMGIYKIQVSNDHGIDESTCNVIVQQRLKVRVHCIIQNNVITTRFARNVEIEC